ncbi:MAG: putative aminopeptidase [Bryobacterales bacterium]|nr:putative aminopeptidase [Bryobacterales bacterium]
MKRLVLLLTAVVCLAAVDPQEQAALDRISAADMRGNLSFLSSDALEGRDTPSRGLDIAAEFIASQFRRAGLEPVGGADYFQAADYLETTPDPSPSVTLDDDKKTLHVKNASTNALAALDLKFAPIYKVESTDVPSLAGKVALIRRPGARAEGAREKFVQFRAFVKVARERQPAAVVIYGAPQPFPSLVEAKAAPEIPLISIADADAVKLLDALSPGESKATLSFHANEPKKTPVQLRNVAGLLRGSDSALSKTYVLLTAHYDHIGVKPSGDGDRIFNGANDDGSGTVSVIEIANALAAMKQHPKRSILFMTFFGEEKGLFGSRYYAEHPLFPLKQTVAQINLEQLGRTDDTEGPQVASATFTGFDFSDLPATFQAAGKATGVKVYKNDKSSDDFFARSDNQSLADAGIPAHTLAVAFDFPDYHQVGDEWQKIDYDNMAKVDRMIALGLMTVANRAEPPHWNEKNSKTGKYVEASHRN